MSNEIKAILTIKQLRKELTHWGRYWASKEHGQGYSKRSACERLNEGRSTNAVYEITVPPTVECYDVLITGLSIDCRRALRARYICQRNWALVGFDSQKSYQYWLVRAEGELLN